MVTVTTYNVYISGTLTSPIYQGDVSSPTSTEGPISHLITVQPVGAAMISFELSGLRDDAGVLVAFDAASPLVFSGDQPPFVCWKLMSPIQLMIGNFNFNTGQNEIPFSLITDHGSIGDPTIVNTYIPPGQDVDADDEPCAPSRTVSPAPVRRVA